MGTRLYSVCLVFLAAAIALSTASPATAQGRIEESNLLAVSYTGTWYSNVNLGHSGGNVLSAMDEGAQAIATFNGTGIRWIGYRDEWSGIAGIFVDGAFVGTADAYSSPAQYQSVVYTIAGLPEGSHTLVVQVLGTRSASSGGTWITVDAFDVTTGDPTTWTPPAWDTATRHEQDDAAVAYSGTWFVLTQSVHSGGSAASAMERNARATFSFSGTGIRWVGYRDEGSGLARVYLDGAVAAVVDTYSPSFQTQVVVFTTSGLTSGPHTIALETTYKRNELAKGRWINVDAFDVLP